MRVIVGLGNPGTQYVGTRHNAGMMLVELLAQRLASDYGWRKHYSCLIFKTPDLVLAKTKDIFMNESGRVVRDLEREGSERPCALYVAHDDLDIRLGEYKIQEGVGPKVHYGLRSVEAALGTKDFWRIRIGVDNRDPGNRTSGEEYVLQRFTPDEKKTIGQVLDRICNQLGKF